MSAATAHRITVVDMPGEPTKVVLASAEDETFVDTASIVLGPAECVGLASDLLNAARRRFGR